MSVLFKALAKASRARENSAGPTYSAQPSILQGGRRPARSSNKRMLLLGGLLAVAAGGVGYLFLPDDEPAPRPVLRTTPIVQAPIQTPPAPVAQTVTPAPVPAPTPAPPPGVAAPLVTPAEPLVQPASEAGPAAAPALSPVHPTKLVVQADPAPDPVVEPAPRVSAPKAISAPTAAIRPVEEDLPTLLGRLRREKAEAAIGQPVKVGRSPAQQALRDEDGNPAIQVGTSPQSAEDAGRTAYDALLAGRYNEALIEYDRALKLEANSPALTLGKAAALQKLGRNVEARKVYERVLALDPSNREALTNMTTLMASQAPEKALTDLRTLHKANPGFSPIDAAIGAQLAGLGDIEGALESLRQAAAMAPTNGLYRLNLAIVQDRVGLAADAAASYRVSLSLLEGGETELPLPIDQIRRRLAYLEKR